MPHPHSHMALALRVGPAHFALKPFHVIFFFSFAFYIFASRPTPLSYAPLLRVFWLACCLSGQREKKKKKKTGLFLYVMSFMSSFIQHALPASMGIRSSSGNLSVCLSVCLFPRHGGATAPFPTHSLFLFLFLFFLFFFNLSLPAPHTVYLLLTP